MQVSRKENALLCRISHILSVSRFTVNKFYFSKENLFSARMAWDGIR